MHTHTLRGISNLMQLKNKSDFVRSYDYLTLAPTPNLEKCTQAGMNQEDCIIECTVMIEQMKRELGTPPAMVEFFILENHHDEAGIYNEPAIIYVCEDHSLPDPEETIQWIYVTDCENYSGEKWDEVSLLRLRELGHTQYQPAKVIQMKQAS